jgi:Zn-dependent protease
MLLTLIDLLFKDPRLFVVAFFAVLTTSGIALLLAITIHEFSHAFVAYKLGDMTAKKLGRLSLNPMKHLDPVGSIMLALVGFGWGKPVPFNPFNLKNGYRNGTTMVAMAGPISNFITAAVFALPIRFGFMSWDSPYTLKVLYSFTPYNLIEDVLQLIILYNIILGVFNLIPAFPLDGSKIALGVLPDKMASKFIKLESYGPIILLGIIMLDWFSDYNLLWIIISPFVTFIGFIVLGHAI